MKVEYEMDHVENYDVSSSTFSRPGPVGTSYRGCLVYHPKVKKQLLFYKRCKQTTLVNSRSRKWYLYFCKHIFYLTRSCTVYTIRYKFSAYFALFYRLSLARLNKDFRWQRVSPNESMFKVAAKWLARIEKDFDGNQSELLNLSSKSNEFYDDAHSLYTNF